MNKKQNLITQLEAQAELYLHFSRIIRDDDPEEIRFLSSIVSISQDGGLRYGAIGALCGGDVCTGRHDRELWELVELLFSAAVRSSPERIREAIESLEESDGPSAERLVRHVAGMDIPGFHPMHKEGKEFPDTWHFGLGRSPSDWIEIWTEHAEEAKRLREADLDDDLKRLISKIAAARPVLMCNVSEDVLFDCARLIAECRSYLVDWEAHAA